MSGDRSNPPTLPSRSIVNLTSQMAQLTPTTSDHRKQAFSQIGSHSSWPTPPTELEHDFPQGAPESNADKSMRILPSLKEQDSKLAFGPVMHSPPASPMQGWAEKLPPIHAPIEDESAAQTSLPSIINDTQLFSEPSTIGPQSPLFSPATALVEERTDSLSPAGGRHDSPFAVVKPTPIEPVLSKEPTFDAIYSIFPQFQGADREFFRRYRQTCYQELKRIPAWRPVNARSPSLPALSPPPPPNIRIERTFRVTKPKDAGTRSKPTQPKAKLPRVSTAASPVAKAISKTPTQKRERQAASAEPQARKRAPPSKPVVVDNWLEVPDFSPPTDTLNSTSNRLRVHWKGVPNDLSNDPEVKFLHPQEVEIAQELKLPANQYLANKRRIFEARLKSIRDAKNFTKTAAQQACNIDVNKTSQLYEAYEKVGWFDESNFKQWLS